MHFRLPAIDFKQAGKQGYFSILQNRAEDIGADGTMPLGERLKQKHRTGGRWAGRALGGRGLGVRPLCAMPAARPGTAWSTCYMQPASVVRAEMPHTSSDMSRQGMETVRPSTRVVPGTWATSSAMIVRLNRMASSQG